MAKLILQDNLKRLAEQLIASGTRVIAPAFAAGPLRRGEPARVGDLTLYRPLAAADEMLADSEYIQPHASFKEYLFPRSECVLRYSFDDNGATRIQETDLSALPEQVILGARPCDAASLPILDKVFSWDYVDSFYFKRREKTTIVSIACSRAGDRCYCTSVGCAPDSTAGSDLLLVPLAQPPSRSGGLASGDGDALASAQTTARKPVAQTNYLVEEVTEKGKALTSKFAALFETAATAPAAEVAQVPHAFELDTIKPWLDTHFEDPFWAEIASHCMGCGTCAFVCPTCHCFDLVDEGGIDGGCRMKNWDTCASSLFTLHGSGHNPRHSQEQRYRQRVMHKFKYYPEKFGMTACVGCGRCSECCPVSLDLRAVLRGIAQRGAAPEQG